jgi:hypothetical protein
VSGRAGPKTLLVIGREPDRFASSESGGYGFLHDLLGAGWAERMSWTWHANQSR